MRTETKELPNRTITYYDDDRISKIEFHDTGKSVVIMYYDDDMTKFVYWSDGHNYSVHSGGEIYDLTLDKEHCLVYSPNLNK